MNDTANYRFCSGLKEAWEKVHGVKGSIWGAAILFTLICSGGVSILSWMLMTSGQLFVPHFIEIIQGRYELLFVNVTLNGSLKFLSIALIYYFLVLSFEMFVLLPMRFGALLIPLRHAVDKSVNPLFIFKFFRWHYIMKFLWLEVLLMMIIIIPGTLSMTAFYIQYLFPANLAIQITSITLGILFAALTIYLAVAYLFSGQIIIDRDVTAWQALEISRKTVTKRWFSIFATIIWLCIVLFIGALFFIIGLIWAVPYLFNVIAILYRDMIGIEGRDPITAKELMCARART